MVVLALLNAVWRGGSTLAEQLLFSTTSIPPFLLDEPANARLPQHSAATSNLRALRCDFSEHNVTHLLGWEYWRGKYSHQEHALTYGSLADLKQRCHGRAGWSRGSHVRAVKTIRMSGQLASFAAACRAVASGEPRLNVSCVLVQLVRHPLTTQRSQRPFAQQAPSRSHSRDDFAAAPLSNAPIDGDALCRPILEDVTTAQALQEERTRLEAAAAADASARAALAALPRVVLVKYDEVVRAPEATARSVHAQLRARTSPTKLARFLLGHLSLDRSQLSAQLRRHAPPPTPPPPPSPRPSPSYVSKGRNKSSAFGTVRRPRACESTDAMLQWPACAELVRTLHPLYVC